MRFFAVLLCLSLLMLAGAAFAADLNAAGAKSGDANIASDANAPAPIPKIEDFNFRMSDLNVFVYDLNTNSLVPSARVSAFYGKILAASGKTNEQGKVVLSVPGEQVVRVVAEKEGFYPGKASVMASLQGNLRIFVEDSNKNNLLDRNFASRARFHVSDDNGAAVQGVRVDVLSQDMRMLWATFYSNISGDAEGEFNFIAGEKYVVNALKEGYSPIQPYDWNAVAARDVFDVVISPMSIPKSSPAHEGVSKAEQPQQAPKPSIAPGNTGVPGPQALSRALETASASVSGFDFTRSEPRLVAEGGRQKYEFDVWKTGRLFFLIPLAVPAGKIRVDVESGAVEKDIPWYSALIAG